MTSSTTPIPPPPPSRISHRAMGGPDLNYLYATDGPNPDPRDDGYHNDDADDRDGDNRTSGDELFNGDNNNNNNNNKMNNKMNNKNSKEKHDDKKDRKPVRRGLRSDMRALRGTSLFLGGEEGPNSKIYCIPGHATRVLCIDTTTDDVYPIGPIFDARNCILAGKYKWLRGIVVGHVIYGLPCHSDKVLRIDTRTDEVDTLDIPYETYFDNDETIDADDNDGDIGDGDEDYDVERRNGKKVRTETSLAHRERHMPWKYHGGAISPHDDCIYAIPQSSRRVLRIDPRTERIGFVGPDYVGRCKWYGGVVGQSDGAIYGIPQNASGVLRIDASGVNCDGASKRNADVQSSSSSSSGPESRVIVTVHGSYPPNLHNWHGAARSTTPDGTIVCVPNNADTVLCIVPSSRAAYPVNADDPDVIESSSSSSSLSSLFPEPELYTLTGLDPSDISTGRHRSDGKYKYLGAMAGTDGCVYCFPSGSERVLRVDTLRRTARSVGPNLRDAGMESLHQNKWQNGLTSHEEGCVYAIPLAARTVLRVRTTTTTTSAAGGGGGRRGAGGHHVGSTWEGGVMASNGCMYCMPNNHKAVLQIVPNCVPSRERLHLARDMRERERESRRMMEEMERKREMERRKAERERRKRERRIRDKEEQGRGEREERSDPSEGETTGSSCKETTKKAEDATDRPITTSDKRLSTEEGMTKEDRTMQTDRSILPNGFVPPDDVATYKYKSGIPTLRSSAHRVKYSLDHREHNPNPKGSDGNPTNTTFLPASLCNVDVLPYSTSEFDFHGAVVGIFQRCDENFVGAFRSLSDGTRVIPKLDNFVVPPNSLIRECQRGKLERAQEYLSDAVASDADFLRLFDGFVVDRILPRLKARLQSAGSHNEDLPVTFFYQRPPTLRIQPGPARALVRAHNDAEYGHQNGELNFWLPLTSRRKTGVDLFCESKSGAGDYRPLQVEYGEVVSFHGSSRRHYVNPNRSLWTRVSLDFRVGIGGYFDPDWQMNGTTNDHNRRKVNV
ncbi:hypothetical protein ACHAXA_002364 [Cyclostephanos tholiformis]|uniref:Uncharacterized protein n=1 Tax=Cyclostephanos tholiformis TaxID=382380 RepID=A0ABD3SR95_9STRA